MWLNRWYVVSGVAAFSATGHASDLSPQPSALSPSKFERVVIDDNFPGGYQVEVADVNGDGKPDVIGVGGGTCAWYENPSWRKRIVSTPKDTPSIISSATADLDGDGKAEIAIAYDFSMNEPKRGKLLLAIQGTKPDDPWTFRPIKEGLSTFPGGGFAGGGSTRGASVAGPSGLSGKSDEPPLAKVPSIHRLRWGWIFGTPRVASNALTLDRKLELVVAPIFGPSARPPSFEQEPANLTLFDTGSDPKSGRWRSRSIGRAPVLHAIELVAIEGDGPSAVLGASNLGVTSTRVVGVGGGPLNQTTILATGAPGDAPKKGASEVHLGKLKDGRKFLSTVEPWHGTDVAVYLSESLKPLKFGPRTVIDATLKEGHALWVADVDGDGDDEVFAGYRGGPGGVLMFDFDGKTWDRTVLDPAVAAQDLRGGDLDGDGRPDVVAIGGRTHNVVWYRPTGPRPAGPAPR